MEWYPLLPVSHKHNPSYPLPTLYIQFFVETFQIIIVAAPILIIGAHYRLVRSRTTCFAFLTLRSCKYNHQRSTGMPRPLVSPLILHPSFINLSNPNLISIGRPPSIGSFIIITLSCISYYAKTIISVKTTSRNCYLTYII